MHHPLLFQTDDYKQIYSNEYLPLWYRGMHFQQLPSQCAVQGQGSTKVSFFFHHVYSILHSAGFVKENLSFIRKKMSGPTWLGPTGSSRILGATPKPTSGTNRRSFWALLVYYLVVAGCVPLALTPRPEI